MNQRLITLVEPDGELLEVSLVSAGTRAGLPSATFDVNGAAWERIETHGLLHADPARRRSAARPFDPAKTVQVEAVLDPVAAANGIDDDLRDQLLVAGPTDPLLGTEAWWTLSATQEVDLPADLAGTGTLQEGISYEHPVWLQDAAGSVGLEEAWKRAMELGEHLDGSSETPLFDLIVAVFNEQGWEVDQPNPEATVVHAPVASDHGGFDLYVRTDEVEHVATAFASLPSEGSEIYPREVLELAARLNSSIAVGSFEANADNGLLTFKHAIDVTGDRLSVPLVRQLIGTVLIAADRAQAAYAAVISGQTSVADAIDSLG